MNKLNGLKIAKEIAESKKGKCLSDTYENCAHQKLLWECVKGHRWENRLADILYNKCWCPECSRYKKLDGLKIAKEIAGAQKGKCLSEEYKNTSSPLLWQCEFGHQWHAALNDMRRKNRKSWCPECAGKKKLTIETARKEAEKKGGKCLSTTYKDNKSELIWQCDKGHIWKAPLCEIKSHDTWCVYCNRGVVTIDDVKKIAVEKGGFCLNEKKGKYLTKLRWRCKQGHEWQAKAGDIKNGQWCPECGRLNAAKTCNNSYVLYHWKTDEELICIGSYEAKTVTYFNKNKIDFLWQSKTFIMPNHKSYRPDAYLIPENKWIEIKGYFRGDAKEKWEWFHMEYPNSELWGEKKLNEMRILKQNIESVNISI